MAVYPYQFVNKRGIAEVISTSVSVSTTAVTYVFPPHSFAYTWYKGLILVRLAQAIPDDTTGTLPIMLETNNASVLLTRAGGEAVTAEDITGNGVYMLYYDKGSNTLQLMTNYV